MEEGDISDALHCYTQVSSTTSRTRHTLSFGGNTQEVLCKYHVAKLTVWKAKGTKTLFGGKASSSFYFLLPAIRPPHRVCYFLNWAVFVVILWKGLWALLHAYRTCLWCVCFAHDTCTEHRKGAELQRWKCVEKEVKKFFISKAPLHRTPMYTWPFQIS